MKTPEQHIQETTPEFIKNLFNSLSIADQAALEDSFNRSGHPTAESMLTRDDLNDLLDGHHMLELRHMLNELKAVNSDDAKKDLAKQIAQLF